MNSGGLVRTQEGQPPSKHRGIAQSVERGFHTPRQPQVRSLLPRPISFCAQPPHQPCARDAGLAKWEGNGSWPRHEAVRSRQSVRACSSSVERRIPNPRQRGFNSFLARHNRSGRSHRDAVGPQRSRACFSVAMAVSALPTCRPTIDSLLLSLHRQPGRGAVVALGRLEAVGQLDAMTSNGSC